MEYTIPFNQFFDLRGVDDGCLSDVNITPGEILLSLRTDTDGEYRRLNADINAFADIKAYRPTDIAVVADAYSSEFELCVDKKHVPFKRLLGIINERATSAGTVDFGDSVISRLETCWAQVGNMDCGVNAGNVHISGKLIIGVIATDIGGQTAHSEATKDFDFEYASPSRGEGSEVRASAQVRSVSYNLAGENKLDVQAELIISAAVYETGDITVVSSLAPDESQPKNTAKAPSVVLYFADQGEELWDIAKKFGSSIDKIQTDNELSDDVISQPAQLLITR
jgi:LysM repeat protein